MKKITYQDKLLCILYKDEDWIEGLNFITPDELSVQVGSWWYKKGKVLDNHKHKDYERSTTRTMEMVFVKQGSMLVKLFDEEKNFINKFTMNVGDLAVFVYGGHGYEILEDDTKIIEAKNGPFINVEKDKERF